MSPASPSPSSWKTQMQINQFHSNFSYKNVCKQPLNMEWQTPKEFGKLASGKADLSGGSNRTVTGKAAFCGCCLALLIGKSSCSLCSFFLVVCVLLPQLVTHSCFARSFSKQWTTNRRNHFQQNQSWEHSCLSFDGKRHFYVCSCVHLHFKTDIKIRTRKRDSCLVSAFHINGLQGQTSTIAQQRENNTPEQVVAVWCWLWCCRTLSLLKINSWPCIKDITLAKSGLGDPKREFHPAYSRCRSIFVERYILESSLAFKKLEQLPWVSSAIAPSFLCSSVLFFAAAELPTVCCQTTASLRFAVCTSCVCTSTPAPN